MSQLRPVASRPHMPGYGTKGPYEGSGLLPWSWAEEQLRSGKNYWVVTLGPDGFPHSTPVWGVWDGRCLSFTCGVGSRKARNLRRDPRCSISTENAGDPVMLEGMATQMMDMDIIAGVLAAVNEKYETEIGIDFLDPTLNSLFQVTPNWAFGLKHADFEGSPTRWTFDA